MGKFMRPDVLSTWIVKDVNKTDKRGREILNDDNAMMMLNKSMRPIRIYLTLVCFLTETLQFLWLKLH